MGITFIIMSSVALRNHKGDTELTGKTLGYQITTIIVFGVFLVTVGALGLYGSIREHKSVLSIVSSVIVEIYKIYYKNDDNHDDKRFIMLRRKTL